VVRGRGWPDEADAGSGREPDGRVALLRIDVADEMRMTQRGMMIAIPEDEWVVFQGLAPRELADVLVRLAAVRLPKYREHPRRPRKPKPRKPRPAQSKPLEIKGFPHEWLRIIGV
jgi:hypothetical protein